MQDLQNRFKEPPAPAKPVVQQSFDDENLALLLAEYGDEEDQEKAEEILLALSAKTDNAHEDNFSQAGCASIEQYAMVHMPIPINQANKIPAAKAAVDAEWHAHMERKTWDVTKVRPTADVIAEANANNVSVHFGYLMDLCHLRHAELDPSLQKLSLIHI